MKSKKCKKCGKVIEGYSQRQVDWNMDQHVLKHKYDEEDESKRIKQV